mgnify:FL=1
MLPILQNQSVLKITSIELHSLINTCREKSGESLIRLNDFHSRVVDELDGDHYENFVVQNSNKTESKAYKLTIEQSTLIGMRESKSVRRSVLDQLKKYAQPQFQIPQNFAEALRLAADQQETIQAQAAQIEAQKPAVLFVERYVHSTGNMGFRQVAKLLRIKENDFRAFLQDNSIMYRLGGEWVAYAQHIAAGRFVTKTVTNQQNGHAYNGALFTPKGVQWIAGLLETV